MRTTQLSGQRKMFSDQAETSSMGNQRLCSDDSCLPRELNSKGRTGASCKPAVLSNGQLSRAGRRVARSEAPVPGSLPESTWRGAAAAEEFMGKWWISQDYWRRLLKKKKKKLRSCSKTKSKLHSHFTPKLWYSGFLGNDYVKRKWGRKVNCICLLLPEPPSHLPLFLSL